MDLSSDIETIKAINNLQSFGLEIIKNSKPRTLVDTLKSTMQDYNLALYKLEYAAQQTFKRNKNTI